MPSRKILETPWGRGALLFLASTLAGLFFATQFYFVMKAWGTPISWEWTLQARLWAWYQWGLLFLLVLWLGRRFPFRKGSRRRDAAVHVAASVVVSIAQIAVNTWTHLTFVADPAKGYTYEGYLQSLLMFAFHRNLLIYWIMLGLQMAFRTYRELKAQELAASELKAQVAEARLHALKMQLHPHFLFNTLNAISALVRKHPAAAEQVINDLSDLLRLALDDVTAQRVPFAREVEFLERYLDIQKVRFQQRLRLEMQIDPETLSAAVPNLLLQPIVENAVHYAVAARYAGGLVRVQAARREDRLVIRIEDDGPGLPSDPRELSSGIGLSATRERLERMYGASHRFELRDSPAGGALVRLELPYERAVETAGGAEAAEGEVAA